jgi:hypothetical protein
VAALVYQKGLAALNEDDEDEGPTWPMELSEESLVSFTLHGNLSKVDNTLHEFSFVLACCKWV